ncbi:unnamed protein product [Closterium sp. NIES-53]
MSIDVVSFDTYGSSDLRVPSLGPLPITSVGACASSVGACVVTSAAVMTADPSLSFTLDSDVSLCFYRNHTTITPLAARVPVALADPTSGQAVARSSTTLPCPAVPSGVLTGLYFPSFSRNLVGVGYLQEHGITVTFPAHGRTAICTYASIGAVLATFTREPHSGLFVLHTLPPQVAASGQVIAPGQVTRPSHASVAWPANVLSHVSRGSLTRFLARLRRCALLASRGPAPRLRPERERNFLVVVDDYFRYTTVFPLAKKSEVASTLIQWLLATEGTRSSCVLCLHSARGGEFHSDVLDGFCGEQGITQTWTLLESPQQNGVAERRIGLPYAVRYAAYQRNLWPRVSRPGDSPTCLWTGSPGVASEFQVWGYLALVRVTSTVKLSARAIPCVFLDFPVDTLNLAFYHPPLHRFLDSCDVRFDKSVSYARYPCRGLPVPPPPLFLAPSPPPAPASAVPPPPPGLSPSGVSHATPLPSVARQAASPSPQSSSQSPQQPSALPQQVTVDSEGVGARAGVTGTGGASSGGAGAGGAGTGGASSGGAGAGGAGIGGDKSGGARAGGAGAGVSGTGGASSSSASARGAGAVVAGEGGVAAARPAGAAAGAAVAAAAAAAAPFATVVPTSEWPSGPWSSLLSSFVSSSGLGYSWFLSSSVTVTSSYSPALLDHSLSSAAMALSVDSGNGLIDDVLEIHRHLLYGLRQLPREWHDTLHTTLADLGFSPSSADPSLFNRRGSTPFFVIVFVNDLVFATADRVAMAEVKSKLQKRHTCTDLGELHSYLGLQITRDRAACTITLSQSHMVQQSSGPYAELVGCLMYLMTCTRSELALPLSVLSRFVATGRLRPIHWTAAVRVSKYLATTSGMGLVLGGRQSVVLTGHCDSSYVEDVKTQRSTQGYCFSLGVGAVSWRSTRSLSLASYIAEAEIYAGAMATQELR